MIKIFTKTLKPFSLQIAMQNFSTLEPSTSQHGLMYNRIVSKLTQELQPVHLEIRDDSHKHSGHAAMKGT